MEKINYKYTTLGLLFLLIITFAWHWEAIFNHTKSSDNKSGMSMSNMHRMPDGSMMMNDGGTMNMGSMTMNDMVNDLKGKTGKDLEKAFITGMIPHHQGAVEMSKLLLQDKTISLQVRKFAEEIIKAQEGEISMMNAWLKDY